VAHGGKNSGSISKKTSYLLAGEKAGPEKLKKAEALDVPIISENEFMGMLAIHVENHVTEDNEPTLF
jgi:DNA ligase (NAD+)